MRGEIHLTYWVLHSNVLYCQVFYFSGIKNGPVLAFIHYIFLAAGAPFATCKVLALYNYIDILAFNAMGGREKGREGTLEKCGELYFSVGCTM